MMLKIAIGLIVVIVAFVIFVATRKDSFRYERSGVINADAKAIFPYISDLRRANLWSPYAQKSPEMKVDFKNPEGQVGSIMEFETKNSGSGIIEILRIVPNERVDVSLTMTAPFRAVNLVEYTLVPEGNATRMTWTMSGKSNFISKLIAVLIDCDKMIGGDFEIGIANLKKLVEAGKSGKAYRLNEIPEIKDFPAFHFVFVEKQGPFAQTAMAAWQELSAKLGEIGKQSKITGRMALYRVEPQLNYRAGVSVENKPKDLPTGTRYEMVPAGKYARYHLKGSYANLPEASGRVFDSVKENKVDVRDAFNVEQYLNDPSVTQEDDLETQILIPTR